MNEFYDAWQKSGHGHVATCVECHLPATGLEPKRSTTRARASWRPNGSARTEPKMPEASSTQDSLAL
jgi:hypothetical protein